MRGWAICFFLNLFVCICAKGQQVFTAKYFEQKMITDTTKRGISAFISSTSQLTLNLNRFSNSAVIPVPSKYDFNSLGFFCRKELQIEQTLKFPVKFRLGSVAYTDQMEGKGKGTSSTTAGYNLKPLK